MPIGGGVLYRLYQGRIRRHLATQTLPRHVAMIIDGNRRWARLRELETAAHGHRAGAAKYHEFLQWCDDLGHSGRNALPAFDRQSVQPHARGARRRCSRSSPSSPTDLSHFRDWRVQHVGSDDGLPPALVAALEGCRGATKTTPACTSISPSATAAGARSRMRCAASCKQHQSRGRRARRARGDPDSRTHRRAPLHGRPAGSRPGHPHLGRAAALAISCSGRARTASSISSRPSGLTCARSTSCVRFVTSPAGRGGSDQ